MRGYGVLQSVVNYGQASDFCKPLLWETPAQKAWSLDAFYIYPGCACTTVKRGENSGNM